MTLPLGYLDLNGRPFGLLAITSKYQEDVLLDVARLWEKTFPARKPPILDAEKTGSSVTL
jgi:amidase